MFIRAKSPSNSYYPTDAVNSSNQAVTAHWSYVWSGSQTVTDNDGINVTLQSFDIDFNPTTNKLTNNSVMNGSGAGMTGTRTDTNYVM